MCLVFYFKYPQGFKYRNFETKSSACGFQATCLLLFILNGFSPGPNGEKAKDFEFPFLLHSELNSFPQHSTYWINTSPFLPDLNTTTCKIQWGIVSGRKKISLDPLRVLGWVWKLNKDRLTGKKHTQVFKFYMMQEHS